MSTREGLNIAYSYIAAGMTAEQLEEFDDSLRSPEVVAVQSRAQRLADAAALTGGVA